MSSTITVKQSISTLVAVSEKEKTTREDEAISSSVKTLVSSILNQVAEDMENNHQYDSSESVDVAMEIISAGKLVHEAIRSSVVKDEPVNKSEVNDDEPFITKGNKMSRNKRQSHVGAFVKRRMDRISQKTAAREFFMSSTIKAKQSISTQVAVAVFNTLDTSILKKVTEDVENIHQYDSPEYEPEHGATRGSAAIDAPVNKSEVNDNEPFITKGNKMSRDKRQSHLRALVKRRMDRIKQ